MKVKLKQGRYLSCQSCRGWSLSHAPRGHVSSTQRWWRALSGWCSPCHQEPWWPGCHWIQTPGRCRAHCRWAVRPSSWQNYWVQAEAQWCRSWHLKKQSVKEIKVNYTENIYWKGSDLMHSWQYPFSVEQLLTAQLVQRFLRVSVTIAALSNMVGFQFNIGSDGCDWLITGLQVHAWEKGQTTCARFVFNPLIETWKTKRERREKMKRCPSAQRK